jgi:hypothetical protein
MTLSFSKFMMDGTDMEQVDIRCILCGRAEAHDSLRLDDAVEWAEQHECAPLRVT